MVDPSCIPCSALIHLLIAELLPVWLTGVTAFQVAKTVITYDIMDDTNLMPLTGVPNATTLSEDLRSFQSHMHCVQSSVVTFLYVPGTASEIISVCPSCEMGLVDCSAIGSQQLMVTAMWGSLSLTVLLLLTVLISFFAFGLATASFGSGRYLIFCWKLENRTFYTVITRLMIVFVIIVWFYLAFLHFVVWSEGGDDFRHTSSMVEQFGFALVTQVVCLKKILRSQLRVHSWSGPREKDFEDINFTRPWKQLLQHNDLFSVNLIDAVWCAKNGQYKELFQMISSLSNQSDADYVLQLLSELQRVEKDEDEDEDEDDGEEELLSEE